MHYALVIVTDSVIRDSAIVIFVKIVLSSCVNNANDRLSQSISNLSNHNPNITERFYLALYFPNWSSPIRHDPRHFVDDKNPTRASARVQLHHAARIPDSANSPPARDRVYPPGTNIPTISLLWWCNRCQIFRRGGNVCTCSCGNPQ